LGPSRGLLGLASRTSPVVWAVCELVVQHTQTEQTHR
jgi:hypothetical protein